MSRLAVIAIIAAAQHHTADPLAQAGPGLVPGAVGQHPAGRSEQGAQAGRQLSKQHHLGALLQRAPIASGCQRRGHRGAEADPAADCQQEGTAVRWGGGGRGQAGGGECELHSSYRQKSITSISVFSVISKISLLFGKGKGGQGKVEVMMVLEVATALCWLVVVIITSKTRKDDCDVSTNGSQYGSTCE